MIALTEQQITCDILPPEIIAGDFSPLPKEAKAFPALNAGIRTAIGDIDLSIRSWPTNKNKKSARGFPAGIFFYRLHGE